VVPSGDAEFFAAMPVYSWVPAGSGAGSIAQEKENRMKRRAKLLLIAGVAAAGMGLSVGLQAQQSAMTFFITSTGPGKAGDLGGLAGADAHCQKLAEAAGAGGKTWRAFLSQTAIGGAQAVNARDRIGKGPWQNAKGVVIAKDVDDLIKNANITKETGLSEKGEATKGRGDTPNEHDILTGSQMDGTAYPAGDKDQTCGNWTKSGDDGGARVGHFDRIGINDSAEMKSWTSSHTTPGCTMEALRKVGGGGLLYCFAAN
jgi:hypothetical protein